ncbi:MAG: hypothetical protein HZA53_13250 [Planctomycetes bacterium]|nr:hypothetical protein [Planctomycetota bacterium]
MQPLHRLVAPLLLAGTAAAGSFSVFVGPPGGTGLVRVLDENAVLPPYDVAELANVRLVALDFSSRAALEPLSACAPRLRRDVPGAARLALPQGKGSLYHFVRDEGDHEETWGFFVVDATRVARVVIELRAETTGVDPFVERVAVASDGEGLLVATTRSAGGDLFEVDLPSARVRNHTANLAPLDLRGRGLALLPAFGAAVHKDGVLRFVRGVDGDAQPVGFVMGEYPVWFERALVASCNGEWLATVAGESPQITYPYVFDAQGLARRMAHLPADLEGAGLAPDAPNGPWLAVSNDGLQCAWRMRPWGPWDDAELFLGSRPSASVAGVEEHVTRDGVFAPYLDEVGVFVFTPTGRLVFVAGDPPGTEPSLFGSADAYGAERDSSGVLGLRNLTATSGNAYPPFLQYGTLEFTRITWLEAAEAYIALDREPSGERVLAVEQSASSVRELVTGVSSLGLFELAPQHLVFATLGPAGSNVPALLRLPLDLSIDPEVLLALPPGVRGARGSLGAGGQCALVTSDGTVDALWHVDVTTGATTGFAQHALDVGPLVDVTRTGVVLATLGSAAGSTTTSWVPGQQPIRVESVAASVLVLGGP